MKDLHSDKQSHETPVLLKILVLGEEETSRGETVDASKAMQAIRQKLQRSVGQS